MSIGSQVASYVHYFYRLHGPHPAVDLHCCGVRTRCAARLQDLDLQRRLRVTGGEVA